MLSLHNSSSPDPYKRPYFSTVDKLYRFCWAILWFFLCRWTPKPFHFWRIIILKCFGAKIGKDNFIYPTCKIWAPWYLETGDVVTIGPGVEIYNPGGAYLGHHCVLSQDAYICGATHDYNTIEFSYIKAKITIEPYVWIGAKAIVLPNVKCMEGSILGAAAVASKDLSSWTVYVGNPAKAIKQRRNFLEEYSRKTVSNEVL